MCLSGYIFWFVNDARSSILMDDLNVFFFFFFLTHQVKFSLSSSLMLTQNSLDMVSLESPSASAISEALKLLRRVKGTALTEERDSERSNLEYEAG